jgi:hypothetical protein
VAFAGPDPSRRSTVSGLYERALAQQRLDARRQRFRERQRVLLAILAVTTVVFFALFVR